MDDCTESVNPGSRTRLTQSCKAIQVGQDVRIEAKGQTPCKLKGCQRVMILANEDALNTLPMLQDSFLDKVTIVEAGPSDKLRSLTDFDEKGAHVAKLMSALPALLHYLLNQHEVSEDLADSRFGVKAYQDPRLLALIEGRESHFTRSQMIKFAIVKSQGVKLVPGRKEGNRYEWTGPSNALYQLLLGQLFSQNVLAELRNARELGQTLSKLEQREPDVYVRKTILNGYLQWTIKFEATFQEYSSWQSIFDGARQTTL